MSGGEPSSIKQKPSCAAELPILSLKCEERPGVRFRIVRVRSCGALNESVWDFKSPLYTKTSSGETCFRYPSSAAQGRWVGESKARARLALLMKTAWPFSDCMRRTARMCEAVFLPFPDKLPRVMARDDGLREHDKHARARGAAGAEAVPTLCLPTRLSVNKSEVL